MTDTLEQGVVRLGEGNAAALEVLAELVARCREIDPDVDHPAQIVVQLDRLKLRGHFLVTLYEKVCEKDLVKLMALLAAHRDGKMRPCDFRGCVTRALGGLTPPYYREVDPNRFLKEARWKRPSFGKPPEPSA